MRGLMAVLAPLALLAPLDSRPRIEVRGVEVSGAWLTLSASSYIAVYLHGPEGLRLLAPDTATAWTPTDSGATSVQFATLPAGVMAPINCVVTANELYRWDPGLKSTVSIKAEDCGPLPPSTSGPGRAIPGRPTQGPVDSWYIPRPNDAADRRHYLIVVATDADTPPRNPASVLDDRVRGVPPLYAALLLGERLSRGGRDWAVVVVPLR